jgi:hypothetical protein
MPGSEAHDQTETRGYPGYDFFRFVRSGVSRSPGFWGSSAASSLALLNLERIVRYSVGLKSVNDSVSLRIAGAFGKAPSAFSSMVDERRLPDTSPATIVTTFTCWFAQASFRKAISSSRPKKLLPVTANLATEIFFGPDIACGLRVTAREAVDGGLFAWTPA